jgi:hypothetical protein
LQLLKVLKISPKIGIKMLLKRHLKVRNPKRVEKLLQLALLRFGMRRRISKLSIGTIQ